jgi:hypothetical protein
MSQARSRRRKFEHHGFLLEVVGIVAAELPEPRRVQLERARGHRVEHVTVVRHEEHGAAHRREVLLEPFDRVDVEVVGGFVQDGQIRLGDEDTREGDAPPLPAAHRPDGALGLFHAELVQDLEGQVVSVPPSEDLDALGEPRLLVDVRGVAVARAAGIDRMRHGRMPGRGVVPIREPLERDRARGRLRIELRLLRQIQHARSLPPVDDAGVGRFEPREDTEERRFAAAVDAEQPDAIPFLDRHRHIREESLGAVGLGQ